MITSFNYKIVCEPYTGSRKPETKISNGFATVTQKTTIAGLKVKADARISDNLTIKAGSTVFMSEELLFARQKNMPVLESPGVEGKFVLVDFGDIIFVKEEK